MAPSRQTQDFFSIVAIQNKLQQLVQENGLHAFYSSNRVAEVARSIGQHDFAKLAERWRLPAQARNSYLNTTEFVIFGGNVRPCLHIDLSLH